MRDEAQKLRPAPNYYSLLVVDYLLKNVIDIRMNSLPPNQQIFSSWKSVKLYTGSSTRERARVDEREQKVPIINVIWFSIKHNCMIPVYTVQYDSYHNRPETNPIAEQNKRAVVRDHSLP